MIQIHVDVDNLWVYEQEFGLSIHDDKEYIYRHSLPLFLDLLNKTGSKATFLIIGKDLLLPGCQFFCRRAIREGHEIANHTWSHAINFGTMSSAQKKDEILKAHRQITKICKKAPVGFRGPGYYQDKEILSILTQLNYSYDSSILPGFAQVLMSTYASLKGEGNKNKIFGGKDYLFAKENPYSIYLPEKQQKITELPISILPFFRLPIHTTFAYYFGDWYYRLILQYLKSKPKYVLYLFHGIDFLDLPLITPNHPVIPLRYPFSQRMQFVEKILHSLIIANGGPLKTSRDTLLKKFITSRH